MERKRGNEGKVEKARERWKRKDGKREGKKGKGKEGNEGGKGIKDDRGRGKGTE